MRTPARSLWAQGFDWELLLLGAVLLAVIFAGFWVVLRVRGWQKDQEAERITPQQQLEHYRNLLEDGLLEPQEFEKLKTKLGAGPDRLPPSRDAAP